MTEMKLLRIIVGILTIISCIIYFTSKDEKIQNRASIFGMIGVVIQIFLV